MNVVSTGHIHLRTMKEEKEEEEGGGGGGGGEEEGGEEEEENKDRYKTFRVRQDPEEDSTRLQLILSIAVNFQLAALSRWLLHFRLTAWSG